MSEALAERKCAPCEGGVDPLDSEQVQAISDATDLLRSLDFGLEAPAEDSDDNYAESDEAEWNDLSEDIAIALPSARSPKKKFDPNLVLGELEHMFHVGEVEVEPDVAHRPGAVCIRSGAALPSCARFGA